MRERVLLLRQPDLGPKNSEKAPKKVLKRLEKGVNLGPHNS